MRAYALGLLSAALLICGQSIAAADCECRANGRLYRHGEIACLRLPTGDLLARCDMVLNNSAWKKVRDGCPEAKADGGRSGGDEKILPLSLPAVSGKKASSRAPG